MTYSSTNTKNVTVASREMVTLASKGVLVSVMSFEIHVKIFQLTIDKSMKRHNTYNYRILCRPPSQTSAIIAERDYLLCRFFKGRGGGLLTSGLSPLLVCRAHVDKCSFSGTLSYCDGCRSFLRFDLFSGSAGGTPLESDVAIDSISCAHTHTHIAELSDNVPGAIRSETKEKTWRRHPRLPVFLIKLGPHFQTR